MKVLLIGAGGREHALGWKIAQSPELSDLYLIPGNPGLEQLYDRSGAKVPTTTLAGDPGDTSQIVEQAAANQIDLVVVGPEAPLADGLGDALRARGIACFGPDANAARLEASKAYMKEICTAANVPTAGYARCTSKQEAISALDQFDPPYVIKADGLAAGKGVIITSSRQEAEAAINEMMDGRFGDAGMTLVIEEFLEGEEASFFVITDGKKALPMIAAQDHKRVGEGDTGPNTGGMGAYAPAPVFSAEIERATMASIIEPTLAEMRRRETPFVGVLFAGLMITKDGPKLIEYNVRFGDPECQILMRLMKSDLLPILNAAALGALGDVTIDWHDKCAALVVLAANGYPGSYAKGTPINGIEAADAVDGVFTFHAGTTRQDGTLLANGGRVLNVTALGATLPQAIDRAYEGVDKINWQDGFCRRDIGWRVRQS